MARCEEIKVFQADCPSRQILDQISDKWSMMTIAVLNDGPLRFNVIKRRLEGITQKALTQTLRRLERNGLVERKVIASSPVAVEYSITPLGRSLQPAFGSLYEWNIGHLPEIEKAQRRFNRQKTD
jgi:DNA-binding HxlR family transcriptional regulator